MEQVVFNWAVAVAGFAGGWILKIIWDAIQELKRDLRLIDSKMHEDFVRRDDFKDAVKEIKDDMRNSFNKTDSMLALIHKKLESKEDK